VIRVGHAVRSLGEAETTARIRELADGLGYWAAAYQTLPTARDTPGALADYRHTRHLPAERWTLLRGRPDDVLELAALLGIKYKEDARGQFAHSNVITILNSQGEIVQQRIGLNQDIQETVRLIQQLAAK